MAFGPGKYDAEATRVRKDTRARGVILIVVSGHRGDGFEVQFEVPPGVDAKSVEDAVPGFLREMADELERTKNRGQA